MNCPREHCGGTILRFSGDDGPVCSLCGRGPAAVVAVAYSPAVRGRSKGRLSNPYHTQAKRPPLVRRCAWCGETLLISGKKATQLRNGYDSYAYCPGTDCQAQHKHKMLEDYKAQSWAQKAMKN